MKRLFTFLALVLGLVSCQTEPEGFDVVVGGEQDVNITVSLPESTRAASNQGFDFTNFVDNDQYDLRYILEIAYNDKVVREVETSNTTSATFPVRLAPNKVYTFTVWADLVKEGTEDDLFYNTTDLKNITLKSDVDAEIAKVVELRDAYTHTDTFNFTTEREKLNMTLTRPFAKVRVVATDLADVTKFGIIPANADVEYTSDIHTSFNAVAGDVNANIVKPTFDYNIVANDYDEVDEQKQLTVFADYIFVPKSGGTISFKLDVNTASDPIKSNSFNTAIPVERNKVTSIVGDVLTMGDNIRVDIKDNGAFETPGHLVEIWDGESIAAPAYDEPTKTYTINQPSQLAWLAAAVSGTLPSNTRAIAADSFAGKTFVLESDIDLGDSEWTPIGMGGKHFEGTFDGNGHTISGLRISKRLAKSQAALFCSLAGNATIKNVVIDEAYIKYPADQEDFYASAIAGTVYGNLTFEDITVKNSTLTGNNKVGAIFAHDGSSTQITINNCHVDNCYIASEDAEDGGCVGGLIGYYATGVANKPNIISNSSVKNSEIVGINSTNSGKRANSQFIGSIKSNDAMILNIENCVVEGNTFTQTINGTDAVTYVGSFNPQFIGGDREEKALGKVTINGNAGIYVDSRDELQAALNNAVVGDNNIIFAADIEGDVMIQQAEGKNIVIDGAEYRYNGTITVDGQNRNDGEETLTIKDINFESATVSPFISCPSKINGVDERYSHNVTIDGCTFSSTEYTAPSTEYTENVSGISAQKTYNLVVKNCEANNIHSLLQVQSCDNNVRVESVKVVNCKNGISSGNTANMTIIDADIIANGYGVRADGEVDRKNGVKVTIEDSKIKAYIPVSVRKMNNEACAIELTVRNTTTDINDGGKYDVAICSNEYEEGKEPEAPVGTVVLNGTDGMKVFGMPVAKVGSVEYYDIDKAIAAWTNNATLTLMADVTLNDVITLKSTEHHILDLSTYTLTAASGKNAIEITCNARSSASYALTVNADATNPGGITAKGKACIYYKKSGSEKDRPIILINNGVFTGSYSINITSNGNTNCPQVWINAGVFNSYMNLTKTMLQVKGGTFHAAINCTGDQNAYRLFAGGRFKSWQFMTADAPNKFAISSKMSKDGNGNWIGTYDVGVYVDDEGYLVVGGPVITEFGDQFVAKATNPTKWSSYLKYSSAAEHGLYYTNADVAIAKHGEANVELK